MGSTDHKGSFFNRAHLVEGAQLLACVFAMLGVIFIGIDWLGGRNFRPSTFVWPVVGILLCVLVAAVSRSSRSAMFPFATGGALGLLYLGVTWLLARTGG
jgi:hypothetical protein